MNTASNSQSITSESAVKAATIPERVAAAVIAEALGVSRQAIEKRAKLEKWPFDEVSVRGGRQKLYAVDDLSSEVRRRVRIHLGELPPELAECVPDTMDVDRIGRCAAQWDKAREWQKAKARSRLRVLEALDRFRMEYPGGRRSAVDRFVALFRRCEVPGLDPELYDQVKRLSRSQLYEWEKAFGHVGIAGLMPQHGQTRGRSKLPLEQQKTILTIVSKAPHLGHAAVARLLSGRFGEEAADRRLVGKFVRLKKAADPELFALNSSRDEWRSGYQLALGSASEKALHSLHYVELDSTAVDALCSDGKRYAIVGAIDVFSRKCKFQVSVTSNSWAIVGLIRRIILEWGLPENVIRDNGKDYDAELVYEGLEILEINNTAVPPYTPEAKPHIERVFKTISHDLFELLPGYAGHNVAERQAIRSRGGFAERGAAARLTMTVALTPGELQEAIDRWVEGRYHQRRHGSLGMSPNAKAASVMHRPRVIDDPRKLDILLAPGGERVVGREGLRWDNGLYWADELIDWIRRTVKVKVDMRDAGRLFVFDPESKGFICEAKDMAISGMTVADKIAAKKAARQRVNARLKAMETLAREVGDPLTDELSRVQKRGTLENLRVGEPVTNNPFVDAATAAAAGKRQDDWHGGRSPLGNGEGEGIAEVSVSLPQQHTEVSVSLPQVTSGDGKVIPIRKNSLPAEPEERPVFKDGYQRFKWIVKQSQQGAVTDEDIEWMRENTLEWVEFFRAFRKDWSEQDRAWVCEICPEAVLDSVVGGL